MSDPININFWSSKNYMKRDTASGTVSIAAPSVLSFGGSVYTTTVTIPHSLAIVPFFDIFYEPFKDGVVWESGIGSRNNSPLNPTNTATDGPYCIGYADTTTLTIELGYPTNVKTGLYTVYYVLYRDYGLA